MAQHGIATFAYDQRGFGRAPGRGLWAGTDRMVDDALDAMALLRRRYPGVPLYVMGESMGAAVAVLAAGRKGADAAQGFILLAPAVWGRATMNIFERVGLWFADFFPGIEWSPRALPIVIRPTDNDAALRALAADPLVIKTARSDTLNGLVDLMGAALDAAPRFTARALVLYGAQDAIVPRAPVARFVAALPHAAAERQRVAFYPAGYHLLLRDLEGPAVTKDVIAWIEDRNAPLPSGADRDARALLQGQKPAASPARTMSAAEPAF
jgi:alpha-beta hydrolase superfamily lysophospholipase